jgi:hypothetical protein
MKNIALCALLTTASFATTAETYNLEGDISFISRDYFGQDLDASLLDVTYYFNPIDNTKGPLAEAAFLNQSSEISAQYGLASQEFLENETTLGVAGKYISDSGIIVGFSYITKSFDEAASEDLNSGNGSENLLDSGALEVGAYLTDVSTLTVSYSGNLNRETDQNGRDDRFSNTLSVKYNHLFLLDGDQSIKLNARYGYTAYSRSEDSDDDTGILDVSGDYYFSRQLSVGFGITTYDRDDADNVFKYEIASNYFITDDFSVYGSYSQTNFDFATNDDDISTFKIGLQARF